MPVPKIFFPRNGGLHVIPFLQTCEAKIESVARVKFSRHASNGCLKSSSVQEDGDIEDGSGA